MYIEMYSNHTADLHLNMKDWARFCNGERSAATEEKSRIYTFFEIA